MINNVSLVKLTTVPTEWQANLIVERLRNEGISASASGGFTAGFRAEAPGMVDVLIDSRDTALAMQVVRAIEQDRQDHSPAAEDHAAPSHHRAHLTRFWRYAWVVAAGLFFSLLLLGTYRAFVVLGLAALIIAPAVWIRQRLITW